MRRFAIAGSLLFLLLLPLFTGSCAGGGSETGNPVVPTQIGLQVYSTNPGAVAVSQGAGGTVIQQAWFSFGVFELIGEGLCANLDELSYQIGQSLVTADLAVEGTIVEMEMEEGNYCGLVVPLQERTPELPDGAPAELADHSVVLKGERGDGVSFTLAHPEQDELEMVNTAGAFRVGPEEDPLLLSFDVSKLMNGVNLDAAELQADGTIRIDEENNRELLDAFEYNLECSLTLHADTDGDGELDEGEPLLATCEDEEEEYEL